MLSFESCQKLALIFNALLIIFSHFRGPIAVEQLAPYRSSVSTYSIFPLTLFCLILIKPLAAAEDKLFKRFYATDLASILHLHFRAFKDKKCNTVQVKITECSDRLKINNPKVQNLNEALEAFFC
jgi:hypothetical protein